MIEHTSDGRFSRHHCFRDLDAAEFEEEFIRYLTTLRVPVGDDRIAVTRNERSLTFEKRQGTNAGYYTSVGGIEGIELSVVGTSRNTSTPPLDSNISWLLRIEEDPPFFFVKYLARLFVDRSIVRRRVHGGRLRVQWKSSDYVGDLLELRLGGGEFRTGRPDGSRMVVDWNWASCVRAEMPVPPSGGAEDLFYTRLNEILATANFDPFVEGLCAPVYRRSTQSSLSADRYFRLLLVGYFEGLNSELDIARRVADSPRLQPFLNLAEVELPLDHATLSRTRRLLSLETHQSVFLFVLHALAAAALVHDDVNQGLRSLARHMSFLSHLEETSGSPTPTRAELAFPSVSQEE